LHDGRLPGEKFLVFSLIDFLVDRVGKEAFSFLTRTCSAACFSVVLMITNFTYGKTTAILRPSPSGLWVLIDENAQSLNDAGFAVTMAESKFLDGPGSYHGFACGLAFADGHSEIHKWKDARPNWATGAATYDPPDPDVAWLQERTSARR